MFADFLYLLRSYGMKIGLTEWEYLMRALELNLHQTSLNGFYEMARAILVKRETDYDKFDQAFSAYFQSLSETDGMTDELLGWLQKRMAQVNLDREEADAMWEGKSAEEIVALMRQRMREQQEAHYGGNKWIGTGGITAFGHSGYAPQGIRLSGDGTNRKAIKTAAARQYRDFREDRVLDLRQFQMAFRRLRLLSSREEGPKSELAVEETIRKTSENGGVLTIQMERPRKNQTKLLLLMDSGGSMRPHTELCSRLFQAVNQASRLKALKVYYFHNCIYDEVYPTPACRWEDRVSTEWLLVNLKEEYKVILVGDAQMGPAELLEAGGSADEQHPNEKAGIVWLRELKKRYPSSVWMNPLHEKLWDWDASTRTIQSVKEIFPMFPLTVKGLERAVRELMLQK